MLGDFPPFPLKIWNHYPIDVAKHFSIGWVPSISRLNSKILSWKSIHFFMKKITSRNPHGWERTTCPFRSFLVVSKRKGFSRNMSKMHSSLGLHSSQNSFTSSTNRWNFVGTCRGWRWPPFCCEFQYEGTPRFYVRKYDSIILYNKQMKVWIVQPFAGFQP